MVGPPLPPRELALLTQKCTNEFLCARPNPGAPVRSPLRRCTRSARRECTNQPDDGPTRDAAIGSRAAVETHIQFPARWHARTRAGVLVAGCRPTVWRRSVLAPRPAVWRRGAWLLCFCGRLEERPAPRAWTWQGNSNGRGTALERRHRPAQHVHRQVGLLADPVGGPGLGRQRDRQE